MNGGFVDILFVFPPHFRFTENNPYPANPLGLGYIVSYLAKRNIRSKIFNMDCNLPKTKNQGFQILNKMARYFVSNFRHDWYDYAKKWSKYHEIVEDKDNPVWGEIQTVLNKVQPKIVGISASIITMPSALNIAMMVKKVSPNTITVIGGPAATTNYKDLLAGEDVDFLVYGEGEQTIFELITYVLQENNKPEILPDICGIIYKKNGQIVKNQPRPLFQNIDDLPYPDRESMFMLNKKGEMTGIFSFGDILGSRGCPYPCKFCCAHVVWGTKEPRMRSVENIIREMENLINTYSQKSFVFWDDLFTTNRQRVMDLCKRIIENKWNIQWVCLMRVNNIDGELLDIMKKAGCKEIQLGIESGNDRLLTYIRKGFTVNAVREKVEIIRKADINWLAFFIVGFPTETENEIKQTERLIAELRPSQVLISICSPYPGTELYHELLMKGAISENSITNDNWHISNNYTGTMTDQ
jgi:radical SAM superfamily enzyme YgiQ (UPF0313 family)